MSLVNRILLTLVGLCFAFGEISAQQRTADQYSMEEKIRLGASYHQEHAQAVEPFTVLGNIHSIGSKNIGIYLITSDQGHILLDTGVREMHDMLVAHVEELGFNIKDIKIILSSHAHYDHVQGHEAMRKLGGAKVMAVGLDAQALRLGKDISPLGFEGWEPVATVETLNHGDVVTLSSTQLTAHEIPGHTQGCTVWTTTTKDHDQTYDVAFFGCRGPNGIVKVIENKNFPNLVDQTKLGFQRLKQLNPDLYLSNHPQSAFENIMDALVSGHRPHPLLEQKPWQKMVSEVEKGFQQRLE